MTWAWHYFTWNADGRIITAAPAPVTAVHPPAASVPPAPESAGKPG